MSERAKYIRYAWCQGLGYGCIEAERFDEPFAATRDRIERDGQLVLLVREYKKLSESAPVPSGGDSIHW